MAQPAPLTEPVGQPLAKISVGDLIQRVAVGIHLEMDQLRLSMRSIDPELRTVSMRAFTSRTLKKLGQLYAIIRWIQQPGPSVFLESLSNLRTQIKGIDHSMCEIQDRLFWSHSYMYKMRSRPLEINTACDILASGTYDRLPESIWTCGKELQPGSDFHTYSVADKTALVGEINTFIRAKLALGDPLPVGLTLAEVQKGYLHLRQNDLWEATVSLDHLSEKAHWVVLSAKILVASRADESLAAGFDHEGVERDLLYVLRSHAAAARDSAVERENILEKEKKEGMTVGVDTHLSGVHVKVEPGTVSSSSSSNKTVASASASVTVAPKTPKLRVFTLKHLQAVCQHMALAAALRFFYIQACELSRGLWQGRLEAEFLDDMAATRATFRFWRCAVTDTFQFQARIEQPRATDSNEGGAINKSLDSSFCGLGQPLIARLYCTVLSTVENTPDTMLSIPYFATVPELLINQYVVGGGVTYRRYFEAVLFSLAKCKLQLLYARLSKDVDICAVVAGGILQVTQDAVGVSLTLGQARIRICIDAQSGDYTAQIREGSCPALSSGVEVFLTEINNLETQRALRDILIEFGVQEMLRIAVEDPSFVKNRVRSLATTSQLLQLMVLSAAEKALLDSNIAPPVPASHAHAHANVCPGGEFLSPSLLARAGVADGSNRACSILLVRSYASLALLAAQNSCRPQLAIRPLSTAHNTILTGVVKKVNFKRNHDLAQAQYYINEADAAMNEYKAGNVDFGLFIVLTTDMSLNTIAYTVVATTRPKDKDNAEMSQTSRKKAKKGKPLTPGQMAAQHQKEEEEEAQYAVRAAEQSRTSVLDTVGGSGSSNRLTFQILRCVLLSHWKMAPHMDNIVRNQTISQLLTAVSHEDTLWIQRPVSLNSSSNVFPSECSLVLGSSSVHVTKDMEHHCYRLNYSFAFASDTDVDMATGTATGTGTGTTDNAASVVCTVYIAYMPSSNVSSNDNGNGNGNGANTRLRMLLLGITVAPTTTVVTSAISTFVCIARQLINAIISDTAAATPLASLQKFMESTLPALNFLLLVEKHSQALRPPVPRPLVTPSDTTIISPLVAAVGEKTSRSNKGSSKTTAAVALATAAASGTLVSTGLQAIIIPRFFLKALTVGVDSSGYPAVEYTAHLRAYVDDGMGEMPIVYREEVAGVICASSSNSNTSGASIGGTLSPSLILQCSTSVASSSSATVAAAVQMPSIAVDMPMAAVCESVVRALGLHDYCM